MLKTIARPEVRERSQQMIKKFSLESHLSLRRVNSWRNRLEQESTKKVIMTLSITCTKKRKF